MPEIAEMRLIHKPEQPESFEGELRSFNPLLFVVWDGREGNGVWAHWVIMRKIPEREKGWVNRRGILTREEVGRGVEPFYDVVDEDGCYMPLDRRVFEHLAVNDPSRSFPGLNQFAAFKAMSAIRNATNKKADRDKVDAMAVEAIDAVIVQASEQSDSRETMGHFTGADFAPNSE